jgi:hypothetical protein
MNVRYKIHNTISGFLLAVVIIITLSSVVILMGSCGHKGCTDSNAINYDPDATRDDGSCEYANEPQYATVTLYRYNDCYDGNVELYMDGNYQKTFTSFYYNTVPSCGTNNADAVSYTLLLGTYHFTAYSDSNEVWDFYADLNTADECCLVALKCGGYAEGSCVSYPANTGSLIVWSSFVFGNNISVKVNGAYRGKVRGKFDATPSCGETNCVTIGTLAPGVYTIDATNGMYSWNNYTVLVRDGWCNSFELK